MPVYLQLADMAIEVISAEPRLLDLLAGVPLRHTADACEACARLHIEVGGEPPAPAAAACRPRVDLGSAAAGGPPLGFVRCADHIEVVAPGLGQASVLPGWETARVVLAAVPADLLPVWELLSVVVMGMVAERGYFPLHASMVERDGCGVVFCGQKACGKTTSCLALGRAGWSVRADDRVYLSHRERLLAWGAAAELRLCPSVTRHFVGLEPLLARARLYAGKRLVAAEHLVPSAGAGFCQPRLLLFPKVGTGGKHEFEPCSAAAALEVLLTTHTLSCDPRHAAAHFAIAAELAAGLPAYRLRLGPDLAALPAAVAARVAL